MLDKSTKHLQTYIWYHSEPVFAFRNWQKRASKRKHTWGFLFSESNLILPSATCVSFPDMNFLSCLHTAFKHHTRFKQHKYHIVPRLNKGNYDYYLLNNSTIFSVFQGDISYVVSMILAIVKTEDAAAPYMLLCLFSAYLGNISWSVNWSLLDIAKNPTSLTYSGQPSI